jgi:hypothetical protein
LLEVNVSPSLMGSSPLDLAIKGQLMTDVFHVVGIYPCDERLLERFTLHPDSSSGNGSGAVPSAPSNNNSPLSYRTHSCQHNPLAFCNLNKILSSQGK